MTIRIRTLVISALAAPFAVTAPVQGTRDHPDLEFPQEASERSMFSRLKMGIWKPAGDGPFPALVSVHGCGGLIRQIGHWRKEAVARGCVAFVIHAFRSHGSPSRRPAPPIPMTRGVKDLLDALAAALSLYPACQIGASGSVPGNQHDGRITGESFERAFALAK